jgi:hypothetical protein
MNCTKSVLLFLFCSCFAVYVVFVLLFFELNAIGIQHTKPVSPQQGGSVDIDYSINTFRTFRIVPRDITSVWLPGKRRAARDPTP